MARLTIDNLQLANEFFEDARLLGIQCPAETTRFIWMVNRVFGYRFQYQHEGEIKLTAQKRHYEFPVYLCREPNLELVHLLYVNGDDGRHLLPELKHIDYLWLLKGEFSDESFIVSLIQGLRNMEQVQLVMELTNEKIKNKEHLVL
jgi:hypothetical protein